MLVDDGDAALLSLANEAMPACPSHGGQGRFVRSVQSGAAAPKAAGCPATSPKAPKKVAKAPLSSKGAKPSAPKAKTLAVTPAAAKNMTPKNVFSRAYHKARSVSEKAGLEPDECKRRGREAGQQARDELQ